MAPWAELAGRLLCALERIASALEARQPAQRRRTPRRGLRARKQRSDVVVPTEIDRARAAKALKKLGYPLS
jgi:hypothetical protein